MAYEDHRLTLIRRLIELPLLLQQGERSQIWLANYFKCNGRTIFRDIKALSEFWPIRRAIRGKEVYYQIPRDAKPQLKKKKGRE